MRAFFSVYFIVVAVKGANAVPYLPWILTGNIFLTGKIFFLKRSCRYEKPTHDFFLKEVKRKKAVDKWEWQ